MSCAKRVVSPAIVMPVPGQLRSGATLVFVLALLVGLSSAANAAPAQAPPAHAPPRLKISIVDTGVYRIGHEQLVAAGWPAKPIASAALRLENRGQSVPVHLVDGGDGMFGAGDWLEFLAHQLAGDGKHFHEYSPVNVYWLSAARGERSARMRPRRAARGEPGKNGESRDLALRRRLHLEDDRLLIRLGSRDIGAESSPETWYWHKLTHVDEVGFRHSFELDDLQTDAPEPPRLRLRFRGLSRAGGGQRRKTTIADHRVEVTLNGAVIARLEWNGRFPHDVSIDDPGRDHLVAGRNELGIRVLPRSLPGKEDSYPLYGLVDIVMLDWIELDYPHSGKVRGGQARVEVHAGAGGGTTLMTSDDDVEAVTAYGDDGTRTPLATEPGRHAPARFRLDAPAGTTTLHLVADAALAEVAGIVADTPSRLRTASRQADYLIIAHRSLVEAVAPLAAFHRSRGLKVVVVDVNDVYDEFNHGILDPRAIDRAIAHVYAHWAPPTLRFVLLVGDASWDTKNTTGDTRNYAPYVNDQLIQGAPFVDRRKQGVPMYDATGHNVRDLVPTMNYHSSQGHAASDHIFADVDEDGSADVAVGRFPVVTPDEVTAIVRKSVAYASAPPPGPWRRNVLWITNEERRFHQRTDQLHEIIAGVGFAESFVYPVPEEASNAEHQDRLVEAFDEGQLLVHFLGHGGRHIWRTGPPDFEKNHDLFTMRDLDRLKPNQRLPIVLSLSCFTAPFDHPSADSIGEKFLRLPGRGAVALIGASWRNRPSQQFSEALIEQLSRPTTIGEAFVAAKRGLSDRDNLYTYNLLGDPALPVPVPARRVSLVRTASTPGTLEVNASIAPEDVGSQLVLEWLDEDDKVVHAERRAVVEETISATAPGAVLARIHAVRVYVWNPDTGRDAIGYLRTGAVSAALGGK
ncbi:MAG: hypothetical protein HRT46_08725 [Deltaproteobacteria bacterium]|nr:hypothetical protein [Deltaproteobacteria bacterium]